MKIGDVVKVYSRTTGEKIAGLVISMGLRNSTAKVLTAEGVEWILVETLEDIERTVLPNG
ncbi:hypothetical protein [Selenomonas ruminantium]|uniref:Uncharacterized protein n=1 Tax=Selenomonas ruminantium TaxID=971 RepID=A0A1I0YBD6_SELRU|nr:hypothetical protein [Selenomonas ruminantium]SFB10715.1 hypothetical protein SAMN05216587_11192 [Selenomonas ruminantium]